MIRPAASSSCARVSDVAVRACSCSSVRTNCREFFTRWWTSCISRSLSRSRASLACSSMMRPVTLREIATSRVGWPAASSTGETRTSHHAGEPSALGNSPTKWSGVPAAAAATAARTRGCTSMGHQSGQDVPMRPPMSASPRAMAPLAFMASSRPCRSSTFMQSGLLSNTCTASACCRSAVTSMSWRTMAAARTLDSDCRNAVSAATKRLRAVLSTSSTPNGLPEAEVMATLMALCTPCAASSGGTRKRPSSFRLLDSTGAWVWRANPAGLLNPAPSVAWPTTPGCQPMPAMTRRSSLSGRCRSTLANRVPKPRAATRHASVSTSTTLAAASAYTPRPATSSCCSKRMASSSGAMMVAMAVIPGSRLLVTET